MLQSMQQMSSESWPHSKGSRLRNCWCRAGPGVCDLTCGRCAKCANYNYCDSCSDNPPNADYTCAQQACPASLSPACT